MNTPAAIVLEHAVRPLLRLARLVSGVEWNVVESIAPDQRKLRDVRASPPVDRVHDYPLVAGGAMLGALRCAQSGVVVLDATQREGMWLIADAMQRLLEFERDKSNAQASAEAAGLDAAEAHGATRREVLYSQRMKRLAHTDVLTGLPNRRAFMKHWDDASARAKRREHAIGLMFIDADRFKAINDSAGHAMGDVVLRAIGATLMSVTSSPDFSARIGGDEFALCSIHSSDEQLRELGERIRSQFTVLVAELGVEATLSIGMVSSASCPTGNMLAFADRALYRSKEAGGDVAHLFACADLPLERAG